MNSDLGIGTGGAAEWIASHLKTPLVLVDIGARDGAHPRWEPLADKIQVFGFEPGERIPDRPNHRYFQMAIGDRDGEIGFAKPDNPYEARVDHASEHRVPMATLDRLFQDGVLPPADVIKIDVEGYEPQVLAGAERYLAASNLIAAELETNFCISPTLTDSHFAAVSVPLLRQRLVVMDIAMDRPGAVSPLPRPGTCNILFCRDFLWERQTPPSYPYRPAETAPDTETILKSIAILEIYGLLGPARAILELARPQLSPIIDVEKLAALLVPQLPYAPAFVDRFHLGLGIWTNLKRIRKKLMK